PAGRRSCRRTSRRGLLGCRTPRTLVRGERRTPCKSAGREDCRDRTRDTEFPTAFSRLARASGRCSSLSSTGGRLVNGCVNEFASARRSLDHVDDLRERPVELALPVGPAVIAAEVEIAVRRDAGCVERPPEREVHLEDDLLDEVAARVARVVARRAAGRPRAGGHEEL